MSHAMRDALRQRRWWKRAKKKEIIKDGGQRKGGPTSPKDAANAGTPAIAACTADVAPKREERADHMHACIGIPQVWGWGARYVLSIIGPRETHDYRELNVFWS